MQLVIVELQEAVTLKRTVVGNFQLMRPKLTYKGKQKNYPKIFIITESNLIYFD